MAKNVGEIIRLNKYRNEAIKEHDVNRAVHYTLRLRKLEIRDKAPVGSYKFSL